MKTYQDAFIKFFDKSEYALLKATQRDLEAEDLWIDGASKLSVEPLATPMDAELRNTEPLNTIPKEVLLDTCDNAGIMLVFDGREECLRDCAIPSLLNTARISGSGVSKVSKEQLAVGLSAFLTAARGESRILMRAGKIAAVLSPQYQYMPISKLLDICDTLSQQLGPATFLGGFVSHSLTVAQYKFHDKAQEITDAYNSILTAHQYPPTRLLTPVVEFRASDTSGEAAKMLTYLHTGSVLIPVGGASVVHVPPHDYHPNGLRKTCVEVFEEEAAALYSKLEYDIADVLPKMLSTPIHYPGNTFVGLCKYANIPQKWGGLVEEEVRMDFPDGSDCCFLDIYEALARTTAKAIEGGCEPYANRVLEMEEGICKVSKNTASWRKYDLPGTVAWSSGTAQKTA